MRSVIKVQPSFKDKTKSLDGMIDSSVKDKLIDISETAVGLSPVDTGAYVTSFSYSVGFGRPRGKSSDNKPRRQNAQAKRQEGLSNLLSDVNKITDLTNAGSIVLRNGSPHAMDVENGDKWIRSGYHVFTKLRNIYG